MDERAAPHLGDELSAYVDGALDGDALAAARAHLAGCPACRHELDVISASRAWLRGLPDVDPPSGFYEHMLSGRKRRMPFGLAALIAGTVVAVGVAVVPSREHTVEPTIAPLVQDHAVSASLIDDPMVQLTPVAVPTTVPNP